jgi:hypothetical protein
VFRRDRDVHRDCQPKSRLFPRRLDDDGLFRLSVIRGAVHAPTRPCPIPGHPKSTSPINNHPLPTMFRPPSATSIHPFVVVESTSSVVRTSTTTCSSAHQRILPVAMDAQLSHQHSPTLLPLAISIQIHRRVPFNSGSQTIRHAGRVAQARSEDVGSISAIPVPLSALGTAKTLGWGYLACI